MPALGSRVALVVSSLLDIATAVLSALDQVLFHCTHGNAQVRGDLLVRQAMDLAKQIHLPALRRQRCHRFAMDCERLASDDLVLWGVFRL